MKTAISIGLLSVFLSYQPTLASFYSTRDSHNDSYSGSGKSYELRSASYHVIDNGTVRLTLDSDIPLAGHYESQAYDGHVGHTDVYIRSDNASFRLKFAPNESKSELGLFKSPLSASVVKENFGRDAGDAITKLHGGELVTNDVQVYEYPGAGVSGSNRIVVEFPYSALADEGDLMLHLTVECGNDSIDLFVPAPEISIDVPTVETELPPITPDLPEVEEDDDDFPVWIVGIPVVVILIFILIGGGPDDPDTPDDKPPLIGDPCCDPKFPPETPPEEPPTKTVHEPSIIVALLFFIALGVILKSNDISNL